MSTIKDQLLNQFKFGSMYIQLIMVNVALFVLFGIIHLFSKLMMLSYVGYDSYFALYALPSKFITQPWGIVSYMFIHADLSHIFFNMLILFFMGRMFEQFFGSKKMLSTYIIGGMFAGLLFIITSNAFPLLQPQRGFPMIGASGAVMAILAATATYAPRLEVYLFGVLKIPLYVIAIFTALLDIFSVANLDGIAHFAHIGGLIYGYIFVIQWKKGKDISLWFDKLMSFFVGLFKRKPKMKVEYSKYRKTSSSKRAKGDKYTFNENKADRQAKLDGILDKIKVSGYDGLTKEEKDFLANF